MHVGSDEDGGRVHNPKPWPQVGRSMQSIVSNGLHSLVMPDGNTHDWLSEMHTMYAETYAALLRKQAQGFPNGMMEAVHSPETRDTHEIVNLQLDAGSAIQMWVSLQLNTLPMGWDCE
jgi:hypothetical protein